MFDSSYTEIDKNDGKYDLYCTNKRMNDLFSLGKGYIFQSLFVIFLIVVFTFNLVGKMTAPIRPMYLWSSSPYDLNIPLDTPHPSQLVHDLLGEAGARAYLSDFSDAIVSGTKGTLTQEEQDLLKYLRASLAVGQRDAGAVAQELGSLRGAWRPSHDQSYRLRIMLDFVRENDITTPLPLAEKLAVPPSYRLPSQEDKFEIVTPIILLCVSVIALPIYLISGIGIMRKARRFEIQLQAMSRQNGEASKQVG